MLNNNTATDVDIDINDPSAHLNIISFSNPNDNLHQQLSAYTMVAISIDKYLAIMYPMRVRMTKTQAKTIILVIWSAALVTSLPTALLSRLSPAFVDLSTADSVPMESQSPITTTTTKTNRSAIETQGQMVQNETSPSTPMSLLETTTHFEAKSTRKQEEPFNWQNKYFCQESWTFWPKGKYYYSMALMVLQFVVPLFVLVITYSRIVVVVWGKKMPGEEDNARDARMARSKRKVSKNMLSTTLWFEFILEIPSGLIQFNLFDKRIDISDDDIFLGDFGAPRVPLRGWTRIQTIYKLCARAISE